MLKRTLRILLTNKTKTEELNTNARFYLEHSVCEVRQQYVYLDKRRAH